MSQNTKASDLFSLVSKELICGREEFTPMTGGLAIYSTQSNWKNVTFYHRQVTLLCNIYFNPEANLKDMI